MPLDEGFSKTKLDRAFSAAEVATITPVLQRAYEDTVTAGQTFDDWCATPAATVDIQCEKNGNKLAGTVRDDTIGSIVGCYDKTTDCAGGTLSNFATKRPMPYAKVMSFIDDEAGVGFFILGGSATARFNRDKSNRVVICLEGGGDVNDAGGNA